MNADQLTAIIKKYIAHVADREGTDFLEDWRRPDWFTDEEWKLLQTLAAEPLDF
jgi:hypothetical protein